ncbi:MAG: putative transcriptional regulator [Halieaceae bacterium]|jgi:predicted transcriptional regulator
MSATKINNEAALVKEALRVGAIYAQKRKVAKFEGTDSQQDKIAYVYRLLVHDKLIQPLAKGQDSEPNMKHKLALWISRQLPADHPLLK